MLDSNLLGSHISVAAEPRIDGSAEWFGVFRWRDGWAVFDSVTRLAVFDRRIMALSRAERLAGEALRRGRPATLLIQDVDSPEVRAVLPNASAPDGGKLARPSSTFGSIVRFR